MGAGIVSVGAHTKWDWEPTT